MHAMGRVIMFSLDLHPKSIKEDWIHLKCRNTHLKAFSISRREPLFTFAIPKKEVRIP
jgi:hypothetical protein